jgi:transposase
MASAIAATVPDVSLFRSGRHLAAWLGLSPRAHSSGGRERQAGIIKQGDGYIRRLLVVGARAVMRMARKSAADRGWATQLLEHKPPEDRGGRACQQDGAHRLGGHGAR